MVTKVWTESCQLSLQQKMNANISELIASKTLVRFFLMSQKNQTVTLGSSEFHFSTLSISDSLTSPILVGAGDIMGALSLENSLINNSLITVFLQTQIMYQVSVLNTVIQSVNSFNDHDITSDTGVKAEAKNITALFAHFKNCSIVGNDHGINIATDGNTRLELSVDQCFIANNGHRHAKQSFGGIKVHASHAYKRSTVVTIVSITATTLSGNKYTQFATKNFSPNTSVSVFNSTFRDTQYNVWSLSCDDSRSVPNEVGSGAYFTADDSNHCDYVLINFTQSVFENNWIGVTINSISCNNEIHFKNNSVVHHYNGLGLFVSALNGGMSTINIVNSHFAQNKVSAMCFQLIFAITQVTITDTTIVQNSNGIIIVPQGYPTITMTIFAITQVTITDTTIVQNSNNSATGIPNHHYDD